MPSTRKLGYHRETRGHLWRPPTTFARHAHLTKLPVSCGVFGADLGRRHPAPGSTQRGIRCHLRPRALQLRRQHSLRCMPSVSPTGLARHVIVSERAVDSTVHIKMRVEVVVTIVSFCLKTHEFFSTQHLCCKVATGRTILGTLSMFKQHQPREPSAI